MKRTTNPVWLWHPRGSVIKHVWIAINQDKKRRPIRPRPGPAMATSKRERVGHILTDLRRERTDSKEERESAKALANLGYR